MMNPTEEVIRELKTFNWPFVISIGCNSMDLNEEQWRPLKGLVVEKATVLSSIKENKKRITYVALSHIDFIWEAFTFFIELKSTITLTMFTKKRDYRKSYYIKLTNSNGTNTKDNLTENDISDIIVAVYMDGAFAITKETALKYCIKKGDGFIIIIPKSEIIPLTDPIRINSNLPLNLKEKINGVIDSELEKRWLEKSNEQYIGI